MTDRFRFAVLKITIPKIVNQFVVWAKIYGYRTETTPNPFSSDTWLCDYRNATLTPRGIPYGTIGVMPHPTSIGSPRKTRCWYQMAIKSDWTADVIHLHFPCEKRIFGFPLKIWNSSKLQHGSTWPNLFPKRASLSLHALALSLSSR